MKNFLTTLLLLGGLLVGGVADAATYYVRSGGSNNNTGTTNSDGGAFRTLAKASAVAGPGDVVQIVSLNPADTASVTANVINPALQGTASGGYITFIGSITAPENFPVNAPDNGIAGMRRTSIKGVRFRNGLELKHSTSRGDSYRDSLSYCIFTDGLTYRGARVQWAKYNTFKGASGLLTILKRDGEPGYRGDLVSPPESLYIGANSFTATGIGEGEKGVSLGASMSQCLVDSNTFSFTFANSGGTDSRRYGWRLMSANNNRFQDNTYTYTSLKDASTGIAAFALRDYVSNNVFARETHTTSGSYAIEMFGTQSGDAVYNDLWYNTWSGCTFTIPTPEASTYPGLYFQGGFDHSVFAHNVVKVTNGVAITIPVFGTGSQFMHNTVLSGDGAALLIEDISNEDGAPFTSYIYSNTFYGITDGATEGVVRFVPDSWPNNSNIQFINNLFYSATSSTGVGLRAHFPATSVINLFNSDYNGFGQWYGTGVRAVGWSVGSGGVNTSGVGDGTSWNLLQGEDLDENSKTAGDAFDGPVALTDSTFADFDPTLVDSLDSFAEATGAFGLNIGAGLLTADTERPAPITTLDDSTTAEGIVVLKWTAVGDDSLTGTGTSYDIRYSESNITANNYSSATPVTNTIPLPASAGSKQGVMITGLKRNTFYYFAIKTTDDAAQQSAISNVLNAYAGVGGGEEE